MPTGFDFTEKEVRRILKEKECELIGRYVNSKEKITIIDKQGYKYYGTFIVLKKAKLDKPFTKANPHTIYNINNWLRINKYDELVELISTNYISATDELDWKCKLCNVQFKRDWHTMHKEKTNKSCKECNTLRRTINQTDFDSKQLFIDDGYILLSEYNGKHSKIIIKDKEGYKYRTSYNIYTNNKKITKFHINNPFTIENIRQWIINSGNSDKIKLISDIYVGQNEHLWWLCKKCNTPFKRTLADMIQDTRNKCCYNCCRKQMGERNVNLQREQEIIQSGYKLLTPYINATKYINIIDEFGYKYNITGYNFDRVTEISKFHSNNPFTIENIKQYINLNDINIKLLSDIYIDSKHNLLWECSCGKKFERCWNNIHSQNQINCKECGNKQAKEKCTLTQKFINDYFAKYGYKVMSEYKNADSQLYIEDNLGYKYFTSYSSFKQTHNISSFHTNNPYTLENIRLWIKLNKISIKLLSEEYVDRKTYMIWMCECGKTFKATWGQVLSTKRYRCEECSKHQSKIAKATEDYLNELNILYFKEYKFIDCKDILCLPFDFAIFDDKQNLKFIIEVNGNQHYKPSCFKNNYTEQDKIDTYNYVHNHDIMKINYCKQNDIPLLILPHWEFNRNDTYKERIKYFLRK